MHPGFKATLGYAEAFLPAAYRSFGKGDPLVGFPGSKIGRGHIPDQREAERPFSLHRSEEHTSELQSLMRISYAVFCLKKKQKQIRRYHNHKSHITLLQHTT